MHRLMERCPEALRPLLALVLLTPREFARDRGLQAAAALAYTTLLALVPVGILAFSLLDVFQRFMDIDQQVVDLLLQYGLPDAAARAGEEVRALIDKAREGSRAIGAIGTLILLLIGMGLYNALERSMSALWKTRARRNPLRRFLSFWLVLTMGPALLGLSVYANVALKPLGSWIGWFLPLMLTTVACFFFYIFLPNTRVRLTSAAIAAVLAGATWELAKWGFNFYVARAAQVHLIYGPLSILPFFILWLYVTWIIVLAGGELAYVHQHRFALVASLGVRELGGGISAEMRALRLLLEIGRRFRAGEPPGDAFQLSRRLLDNPDDVRTMIGGLESAGFLRKDSDGYYLPARELAKIAVADVLATVRGTVEPLSDEAERSITDALLRGEQARGEALAGLSLAGLLDRQEA